MELARGERAARAGRLTLAAVSSVFTIRYVAEMLGRDEDLLWSIADDMEPEDGCLRVIDRYDDDDSASTIAFSAFGIECLQELLADRINHGSAEPSL